MTYTFTDTARDSARSLKSRTTRRRQRIAYHLSAILRIVFPLKERSIALAALAVSAAVYA